MHQCPQILELVKIMNNFRIGPSTQGQLLCILTSERVLCMPFAGQNHIFGTKTGFSIFFSHDVKNAKKHKKTCYKRAFIEEKHKKLVLTW